MKANFKIRNVIFSKSLKLHEKTIFFFIFRQFIQRHNYSKIVENELSVKIDESQKDLYVFNAFKKFTIDNNVNFLEIHFNFFNDNNQFEIFYWYNKKFAFIDIKIKIRFFEFDENLEHIFNVFRFIFVEYQYVIRIFCTEIVQIFSQCCVDKCLKRVKNIA